MENRNNFNTMACDLNLISLVSPCLLAIFADSKRRQKSKSLTDINPSFPDVLELQVFPGGGGGNPLLCLPLRCP